MNDSSSIDHQDSDSLKTYTEANRAAWNEATQKHQTANQNKWDERFANAGYVVFESPELEQLQEVGIPGKDVAHLCCNNGVELLSLKNLGAKRCVGFDISDAAVAEASERSRQTGIDCEFIRSDVYEIDESYDHQFDLVYVSVGCFGWLPDLKRFFRIATRLLRAGGQLFIYEMHPFSDMLSCDSDAAADPLKLIDPYFQATPHLEQDGIDYIGKTSYASPTSYWFVWPMSEIVMGIIAAGFRIQFFQEYSKDISASHQRNEAAGIAMPLSYLIVAQRTD